MQFSPIDFVWLITLLALGVVASVFVSLYLDIYYKSKGGKVIKAPVIILRYRKIDKHTVSLRSLIYQILNYVYIVLYIIIAAILAFAPPTTVGIMNLKTVLFNVMYYIHAGYLLFNIVAFIAFSIWDLATK